MSIKRIYHGRVYVRKDVRGAAFDDTKRRTGIVTLEQYSKEWGDNLFIFGYFNMDENGMITDLYILIAG